jgi:hypothetical protein
MLKRRPTSRSSRQKPILWLRWRLALQVPRIHLQQQGTVGRTSHRRDMTNMRMRVVKHMPVAQGSRVVNSSNSSSRRQGGKRAVVLSWLLRMLCQAPLAWQGWLQPSEQQCLLPRCDREC